MVTCRLNLEAIYIYMPELDEIGHEIRFLLMAKFKCANVTFSTDFQPQTHRARLRRLMTASDTLGQ